ncbi:CDP-glycerol glycerophosphotransferase family protein [Pradoshia sp.]
MINVKRLFFKDKKRIKRNHYLSFEQTADFLYITGKLHTQTDMVAELWLKCRKTEEWQLISHISPSPNFQFEIRLKDLLASLPDKEAFYDWYVTIQVPTQDISEKRYKKLSKTAHLITSDGREAFQYRQRLGRYQTTDIAKPFSYIDYDCKKGIFFVTEKGNLSLSVNKELKPSIRLQIDRIRRFGKELQVCGQVFTRHSSIQHGEILLRNRATDDSAQAAASFHLQREETRLKYGLNRYTYQASLPLLKDGELLNEGIYDAFLQLHLHDVQEPFIIKLQRPTFRARHFAHDLTKIIGKVGISVHPYFTFKASNLALEILHYPADTLNYLVRMMKWSWLLQLANRSKDVWLVGERPYKAQDTGYHFFKYVRENHPDLPVYYVIDQDSPELKNVEPLGNVVYFKSKEHIRLSLIAKRIISSHHADYLYPIRTEPFKRKVHALKIFLQHGVMGTKNMVANYGKNTPSFYTDIFLVSSDFEKAMIVNDFGYSPNQVYVTGLSRFDELFACNIEKKRQLLIIPTWRDWIITQEKFLNSEYYQRYRDLVQSETLRTLSEKYHFDIVFCLHPNMQLYTEHFRNSPYQVISQGEVDVQTLIKESAMMLTDYSSVAFDFSFLEKPVIYYQFDRSRFIGKRPSHLNLDEDLPGEMTDDLDEILRLIEEYAAHDFKMKEEYRTRAQKFLKYADQSSSERIFKIASNRSLKPMVFNRLRKNPLIKGLWKKYRNGRYYYPSMKVLYTLMRIFLPVDLNLIVFESGVGKQYADSPRMIYEKILEQDLPYKKVWIVNKSIRFRDPDTIKVKRLSPVYYYYLAKAGVWVNNQNFPAYIKKRSQTTYLQTWHGTPLKKMLYDIDQVQGRQEGYVERVGAAVKNWDYLISPSSYATKAFRSAFRYEGEVLETGYPRNDLFYQDDLGDISHRVRERLKLPSGKKVILYAPTFRDNQTSGANKFTFEIPFDMEAMKQQLSDDYILLLRLHVVISNKVKVPKELRGFVFNVSNFSDIQELLTLTDVLITDYSSVMFDYANLKRPMLFYVYDFEEYRDRTRGFYMDFEAEAPGPLLKTSTDLIEALLQLNQVIADYEKKYQQFYGRYCYLEDGHATDRVVRKVFQKEQEDSEK